MNSIENAELPALNHYSRDWGKDKFGDLIHMQRLNALLPYLQQNDPSQARKIKEAIIEGCDFWENV